MGLIAFPEKVNKILVKRKWTREIFQDSNTTDRFKIYSISGKKLNNFQILKVGQTEERNGFTILELRKREEEGEKVWINRYSQHPKKAQRYSQHSREGPRYPLSP